jgi:hypothetical protein
MTTIYHFAIHHIWYVVAIVALAAATALVLRKHVMHAMRLAKAAATDKRLPRSVRWLFRIGLAAKLFPGPDFGIDELAFGIGIVLLSTKYRSTWNEIRTDVRTAELARQAS